MSNIYQAPYRITQAYGCTGFASEPPLGDCPHFHRGLDVVGPSSQCPIFAAVPGVVFAEGQDKDGAIYVIEHADTGHWLLYWHLSRTVVNRGQRIDNAIQIGNQGSTGNSTGEHCHFEVDLPGAWGGGTLQMHPTDPMPFLEGGTNVTEDQDFANCWITLAQRWPTNDEVSTWKSSGLTPYEYAQRFAPNPLLWDTTYADCFITVFGRWPTSDEVNAYKTSPYFPTQPYTHVQQLKPSETHPETDVAKQYFDHIIEDATHGKNSIG